VIGYFIIIITTTTTNYKNKSTLNWALVSKKIKLEKIRNMDTQSGGCKEHKRLGDMGLQTNVENILDGKENN